MSRGRYDSENDILIPTAGKEDTSVPTFTMAEWEALTDAQKAEYDGKLFVISDDFNGMTVDDELSDTSIHPVQNKVITEEINSISAEMLDMNNILGAKNVLPISVITQTVFNGVTIINNHDGTYTLNGTCTADASYSLHDNNTEADFLARTGVGSYTLSGYPSGKNGRIVFQYRNSANTEWADAYYDEGEGVDFPYDGTKKVYTIYLLIKAGDRFEKYVFKPMIRPASIKDDTYVPYAMTNRELTDNVISYKKISASDAFTIDTTKATLVSGSIESYGKMAIISMSITAKITDASFLDVATLKKVKASNDNIYFSVYDETAGTVLEGGIIDSNRIRIYKSTANHTYVIYVPYIMA